MYLLKDKREWDRESHYGLTFSCFSSKLKRVHMNVHLEHSLGTKSPSIPLVKTPPKREEMLWDYLNQRTYQGLCRKTYLCQIWRNTTTSSVQISVGHFEKKNTQKTGSQDWRSKFRVQIVPYLDLTNYKVILVMLYTTITCCKVHLLITANSFTKKINL